MTESMLSDTRRAFDSVAASYDGPRGNNALIQRMRGATWRAITGLVNPGGSLLDIGCGTGTDALHFAARGFSVCATDWSPRMAERTAARAAERGLTARLQVRQVGAQELHRLEGAFDGVYSNFGPLNCVPDLRAVSHECARLLGAGGHAVFTVIGRICPWEVGYYLSRLKLGRALVRRARGMIPVNLNRHTVWTRYFTPREFYRHFASDFELVRYRALGLFVPPPYLIGIDERVPALINALAWLDQRVGGWPVLRDGGDHFLMILQKRPP